MIGCVNWALANEGQTLQNNATNISTSSCDIILQPTCNLTATEINNGTEQHPNGVGSQLLTIFLLVIDLPSSALLLAGAKLKVKTLLLPWMIIMALKMLGYVTACCIYVQFVLVEKLDESVGFGMKHYARIVSNDTSDLHYSIFSGNVVDGVQKRFTSKISRLLKSYGNWIF